ncbi:alpha-L-fucosidase [Streptomyces sp. NPDC087440]|uniref:alpha-L-fucosidase n=1 Tax=Streptomyces sp. NPDC087440 TaxID=3365790 RepID=UPI003829712B
MRRTPVLLALSALLATGALASPGASAQPSGDASTRPTGASVGTRADAAPPPGSEPRNHAFGATATQSSTDFGGVAARALDGKNDGNFAANSVTHTADQRQPWWQVDLGGARQTDRAVLWNRTDCCSDRLADFWVLTSEQPITADGLDEARQTPGVRAQHVSGLSAASVTVSLTGKTRYLRVQRAGSGHLSLAEVQVYGQEVVAPSAAARQWVRQSPFGMFLHYGMGTYTDSQWADPNTPAAAFDPKPGVDPDQWAKAMKSAGMTFGVLTAKHHDGFALWPTRQSSYSVAGSPWQGGKGDVVRDYVQAMRANGLKVGLYFSVWDRHNGDSTELVKKQLTELLTRYGKIDYLWFDGWGWQIPYSQIPYQPVRDHIRKLSPGTVVANNDHFGTLHTTDVIVYEVPVQGMPPAGNPQPVDASDTLDTRSTWFRTTGTGTPKPAADIASNLGRINAGNGLYLLNVGPGKDGRIDPQYAARLKEIGGLGRK